MPDDYRSGSFGDWNYETVGWMPSRGADAFGKIEGVPSEGQISSGLVFGLLYELWPDGDRQSAMFKWVFTDQSRMTPEMWMQFIHTSARDSGGIYDEQDGDMPDDTGIE